MSQTQVYTFFYISSLEHPSHTEYVIVNIFWSDFGTLNTDTDSVTFICRK